MIPAAFEYHAPTSIGEATSLLARLGDEAKVLSGGQSLIPIMKLRLASPGHIVDINGIPGLAYIKEADGFLHIGALTRESDLEDSDIVRARYPLLFDTCQVIADPVVRNLATVGGNLAHGDPANDHPATMVALDAFVVAVGPRGERNIPVASFFTGPFTTALRADEILTEIWVPSPPPRSGGAYVKLERRSGTSPRPPSRFSSLSALTAPATVWGSASPMSDRRRSRPGARKPPSRASGLTRRRSSAPRSSRRGRPSPPPIFAGPRSTRKTWCGC